MPYSRIRSIATALLLAFIVLTVMPGCAPKRPPEPVWEQEARGLLDQADSSYSKKLYEEAAKTVETFFDRFPKSSQRDRGLYLLGEIHLARKDYPHALRYYKDIIEKYPASSYIIQARFRLGQCYFELKEYTLSIANLEDKSRITDRSQLTRISEMLSTAYVATKHYASAVKEFTSLAETAESEKQRAAYRGTVRELIEKDLTEEDLKALAAGTSYPADIAQLRLAGWLIEQRRFRDSIEVSKNFLGKYPSHADKTRGEMLLNEAVSKLTFPRYFLGALVPQSGPLAFFGDRVLKGIQLAVSTYNIQDPDNRVELVVKDTEGSPDKAVAALNELSSKGIVAAIGPLLTKEAEALVPALEKMKVPVITPAASGEGIGNVNPWLFRNGLTNASQAEAAVQFALGLKLKKFVIFYPDDPYGKDLARLFTRGLERNAEVLASVAYPADVKDFGPYIRRVREIDLLSRKILIPEDEAVRKKLFEDYAPSFDAMYLPGHADKVGLLIPQLAFYNITGVTLIGSNAWHSADLLERAQRYAEGTVFVDGFFQESSDPAIKSVVDAYRSAYQEEPDILSAQAYDAAMMVLSLIREGKDTPLAIRDGLLAIKNYPGLSGATTFLPNGDVQKKLFLIKVQDGKFTLTSGEK